MADPDELARLQQRAFYQEQARRFQVMADEYAPAQYAAVPLPIPGITAVIVIHASSGAQLEQLVHYLDIDWRPQYSEYGRATTRDIHTGNTSVRFETVHPEMTPERYVTDLAAWANEMKGRREAVTGE